MQYGVKVEKGMVIYIDHMNCYISLEILLNSKKIMGGLFICVSSLH